MTTQIGKDPGWINEIRWKNQSKPVLLGNVLKDVMAKRISHRHGKVEMIEQIWSQLLPLELTEHCRIDSFNNGVLKVIVDGPGYMHEMRLCKSQLLEQLKTETTGIGIKDIRFDIG